MVVFIDKSYKPLKHATEWAHPGLWELTLNIKGSGTAIISGQSFPFEPGTITLCPPNTLHSKRVHSGTFEDIYIQFNHPLVFDRLNSCVFSDYANKQIETLMMMAYLHFNENTKHRQSICDSYLNLIAQLLTAKEDSLPANKNTEYIKYQILSRFSDPDFSLDTVYEALPMCKDHLRRCFKEEYGTSPLHYLLNMRIEFAYRQLLRRNTTGNSISDIAFLSGFYDPLYFTRQFRKRTGKAPSEIVPQSGDDSAQPI